MFDAKQQKYNTINSFTVVVDVEYCHFQRVSCHPIYLISLESLKTVKLTALNYPSHEKSPDSTSQEILKSGSHFVCIFLCLLLFVLINFTHILQGYITGTGAIIWLPQCQWCNPEKYGLMHHMNTPLTYIALSKQSKVKQHAYFMTYTVDWSTLIIHQGSLLLT